MSASLALRDEDAGGRLTLASLLALGLHAAVLLGGPSDGWRLRFPEPLRFDVVLLAPMERLPPPRLPLPDAASVPADPVAAPLPGTVVSTPAASSPPSVRGTGATAPPTPAPVAPAPKPLAPSRAPSATASPATNPARTIAPKWTAPVKSPIADKTAPAPRPSTPPTAPRKLKPPPAKAESVPSDSLSVKPRALPPPAKAESGSPDPPPVKPRAASPPKDIVSMAPLAPVSPPIGEQSSRASRSPERLERSERKTSPANFATGGRSSASTLLSQVAGLEAEKQRRERAGVRDKRVSPNDTQSLEGFYIAAWARKVEQIGEMNFPEVARTLGLSAGPVLDVAIRADGSLQEVRLVRSSGNAELDRAAQRIVRLGAPYAPFSASLRQRYDVLHIARPWRFEPSGRLRSR